VWLYPVDPTGAVVDTSPGAPATQVANSAPHESMCEELGIGLVPYSPLGKGILTGKITADFEPRRVSLGGQWLVRAQRP
jgi:aryl-alcohol dehydrogenase-like predicted oxidoreductase